MLMVAGEGWTKRRAVGLLLRSLIMFQTFISRHNAKFFADKMVVTFFFFQAEDGIRDVAVTGVQMCSSDLLTISLMLGYTINMLYFFSRASARFCKMLMVSASDICETSILLKYSRSPGLCSSVRCKASK